jgi:hypothetical protein
VTRSVDGSTRTWPARGRSPATFRTAPADRKAPLPTGVRVVSLPDGTARVSWLTAEPSTSEVRYTRPALLPVHTRRDDGLVRRHEVVLTDLRPRTTYWLTVVATDAAGNRGPSRPVAVRTRAAGVAVQTAPDLGSGRILGDLRVSDRGLGALVLPHGGTGTFVSRVLDAQQKVHWTGAVVDHSGTPGSRWVLTLRTGSRPEPDRSWSGWHRVRRLAVEGEGRYLQFRLLLSSPSGARSAVAAVGFTHDGSLPTTVGELGPA